MPIRELSDWNAEGIRITLFPASNSEIVAQSWWTEVVGDPPEEVNLKPKTGEEVYTGLHELGKLSLTVQPDRIHWKLVPHVARSNDPISFPTVGPVYETFDVFQGIASTWVNLETCPSPVRLAFGIAATLPVEGLEHGYSILNEFMHSVQLDPKNTSDFMYQINKRRDSKLAIEGLSINRMMRWSVVRIDYREVRFEEASTRQVGEERAYACRVDLDVNTVADFEGELPKALLEDIFGELASLSLEIIAEGDIE